MGTKRLCAHPRLGYWNGFRLSTWGKRRKSSSSVRISWTPCSSASATRGVVGEVAARGGPAHDLPEDVLVGICFREDPDQGRPDEVAKGLHGFAHRGGWIEDATVRHHTQKLIQARPEQGVGHAADAQRSHEGVGGGVVLGALSVGVHQDVRVEPDHHRPSMMSKSASRSWRSTPGIVRPLIVLSLNRYR